MTFSTNKFNYFFIMMALVIMATGYNPQGTISQLDQVEQIEETQSSYNMEDFDTPQPMAALQKEQSQTYID